MNLRNISFLVIVIGLILFYINISFFQDYPQISSIMNMTAVLLVVGVPLIYRYMEQLRAKKMETIFPKLLRDITESINAGMTLPQAFKSVSMNDYDILSQQVRDMNAKISFGITFEKVMENFARQSGSKSIRRSVQMIIETHRSGGTVANVLEAVAESLQELEKIKKQRISSIYAQMINGYIIYIIFLGIMIGLSSFLIPTFEAGIVPNLKPIFIELFTGLIVIQGFFSGISIGKLSEGTMLAGIKHSLILIIIGYSAFVLFG